MIMHDAYNRAPAACLRVLLIHEPDDGNSGRIHCTFPSFGSSTPRDTRPWGRSWHLRGEPGGDRANPIFPRGQRWLLKAMGIRQPGDRGPWDATR
ncbi:hypothetical protein GQ55_9G136600 [Panicum hallii var. hallii]|uniref:Uncharacterized protein n=1 Tax=Panicum hallii var. hallii TaxID=1504633 RepID=A0A2T7C2T0_9POAL|nr:hypothetical protein GQ55_9G136600 [Panicum hallii var. hallii]